MRAGCFAVITIAAVFATIIAPPRVLLVWNTTASVPVGLYVVSRATPRRGDLFVIQLPPEMETLAVSRAILTPNTPVLKPIAALFGDRVCRLGAAVTITGAWPQSLVGSIAATAPYPSGKDAGCSQRPKSSSSPSTRRASIAATTGRCISSLGAALRIPW